MEDQIVLITGANSGIGKAAAIQFAAAGYKVVMGCRNVEAGEKVRQHIKEELKNDNVHVRGVDMSSYDSIQRFHEGFKAEFQKLDILIHNAAYFNHGAPYAVSEDGIELTFATNVVGPYLLTELMLEQLKQSNDPRILLAGSNIVKHFFDPKKKIEYANLRGENNDPKFSVYKMYCQSKMALVMLTFKLAEVFRHEGIKVNALQINGATMSKETLQKVTFGYRMVARVQNLFFKPTSYMANNYYEICTSEKFKDVTGKLFNDKLEIMEVAPAKPEGIMQEINQVTGSRLYPSYAHNKDEVEKMWTFCREVTEMVEVPLSTK